MTDNKNKQPTQTPSKPLRESRDEHYSNNSDSGSSRKSHTDKNHVTQSVSPPPNPKKG